MTEFATNAATPRNGVRFKHIALLLFVAFAGGAGASWWLADEYGLLDQNSAPAPIATVQDKTPVQNVAAVPLAVQPTVSSVDSVIAAGNTARAEGLLVAFAARRTLDSGAPLGYLADQLRLRFGATQPKAVMTVLQASQTPITLQSLQADLTAIDNMLVTGTREETVWATIQREFSELFVLRKSESPSPAPTQRLLRAHALVESGNLGGAILEVSEMPGANSVEAQAWLVRARTYNETRKALDQLERSALAAPPLPVAPVMPPIAPEPQTALPTTTPE
ncbi:hypothetical protein [Sphingorhabdus contaminans]|uniref:hypothetical protein n=1 Tax=Sphingorhabdus contaminans TaxID=1343899 RepID=UPI003D278B39